MRKEKGVSVVWSKETYPDVGGKSTCMCQKKIMSGEGQVLVVNKEEERGVTCPFRYPVMTKNV